MSAISDLIGRIAVGIALGMVAMLAALTGLGFLFASLYLALTRVIEPDAAALATGMSAFLVALIVLLIARRSARPASLRPAPVRAVVEPPATAEAAAAEVGNLIAISGKRMLHTHAMGATATALVAGMAMGLSPRLRRAMWRLLQ